MRLWLIYINHWSKLVNYAAQNCLPHFPVSGLFGLTLMEIVFHSGGRFFILLLEILSVFVLNVLHVILVQTSLKLLCLPGNSALCTTVYLCRLVVVHHTSLRSVTIRVPCRFSFFYFKPFIILVLNISFFNNWELGFSLIPSEHFCLLIGQLIPLTFILFPDKCKCAYAIFLYA